MANLSARLQQALGDAYSIERELGRGGMATVFLAQDLKHHRPVALKVLHPELAAIVGPERFLQEIEIAGRLSHPHILGLIDSGTVETGPSRSTPYYVMPYVEGETLREQIDREKQLPLEHSLAIVRQVASALGYAHSHGVIHRDIKPENILLQGTQAVVADFGIARAISAAGGERLTETGLAIGTPGYMSPEQATGERTVDARSDIYALGCVLYEMLAGQPPFTGATAQAILARRLAEPVPPLRTVRETVPTSVEQAILKALARVPADRFATIEEFSAALEAKAVAAPPVGKAPRTGNRLGLVLGSAAGLLAVLAGAVSLWRGHQSASVNPKTVAVLPFRVSGADPSLAYLREGMPELLAVKLTGEGGPRSVDPSAVLSAWKRAGGSASKDLPRTAALRLARGEGVGWLIEGAVVGSPLRLTLNATLTRLPAGSVSLPVSVEGPVDSLSALVDQLTAGLLANEAGQITRLASLATTSLPALRAFLDGQAAYRRARFQEAVAHFTEALRLDSTFALAGLSLSSAVAWCCEDTGLGARRAWAGRERLSRRDRVLLMAEAGPNYPAPSSRRERLGAWERAVDSVPDRPEVWYGLGDALYHFGRELGVPDSWKRAQDAFRHCLELDSALAGPAEHLVEMAQIDGDTGTVRRLATLVVAADTQSEIADYLRWHLALAAGDSARLERMHADYGTMTAQSLGRIALFAQEMGTRLGDAALAIDAQLAWVVPGETRLWGPLEKIFLALNLGRPSEARTATETLRNIAPPAFSQRYRLVTALYGEADTAGMVEAVRTLASSADGAPASTTENRAEQFDNVCALGQWRAWHGEWAPVARAIRRFAEATTPIDSAETVISAHWCAALLTAISATARKTSEADAALSGLDSLTTVGPLSLWGVFFRDRYANLVVARLYETQGDPRKALAAVRRRIFYWATADYLSIYLREEGRLAALTGDREGAVRAYQHYLRLRIAPEPSIQPEVDRVKAELAKLGGEKKD